jgi:hypothetical protein
MAIIIKALAYLLPALLVWYFSDQRIVPAIATFCALLVLRGFFFISEYLSDEIDWRLNDGRRLYAFFKAEFHKSDYPDPSKMLHFLALDFLERMNVDGNDDAVRIAAKEMHRQISIMLNNLSKRDRKRYEAVLNKAFIDWFSERWRPVKLDMKHS